MRFLISVLLSLATQALAAPSVVPQVPTVDIVNGSVVCEGPTGAASVAVAPSGHDSQAVLSPDGHTVAFVRTIGEAPDAYTAPPSELWIGDCRTGDAHRLLASKPSDKPMRNLASVNSPTFSLDGGFVYVLAQAWVTSDAIHQVNIKTGSEKYITDSNDLRVIRNGPYRGYLLVQPHMYHRNGNGSYDPHYVYRPDGKWKMLVPGTDNEGETDLTAEWLATKGWQAW